MIISETEHYALYKVAVDPYYKIEDKMYILNLLEEIRSKGLIPLHYENRQHAYVCEKTHKVNAKRAA